MERPEISNVSIRQETPEDHQKVFQLLQEAFKDQEFSDQSEPELVKRLRSDTGFVPALSMVAETGNTIAGYILLTEISLRGPAGSLKSLALAPVAVRTVFQKKGIGSKLILHAHKKARELGYTSIVVIGHEDYYPRFGYQPAHLFGITFPFEVPVENAFVLELEKDALLGVQGKVIYADAFFEAE
jgi:predicted N-acetyltransferase YhbS